MNGPGNLLALVTGLIDCTISLEEQRLKDADRLQAQGELLDRLFRDQKALRARIHQLELRTETEGEPA